MKKSIILLVTIAILISLFLANSTPAEAKRIKLGKDTGKIIGGMIFGVIVDRAQEKERVRREERRERSRIKMEEERNASRIRQEQARREELKRQEELRDLQFQQKLELERERQERERRLRKQMENPQPESPATQATFNPDGTVDFQGRRFANPQDFASWLQSQMQKTGERAPREVEMDLYPSGACKIRGIEKTFSFPEEALAYLSQIWPGETIRLRVYKAPASTSL